jgi:glycine hydroxymethyltransferase
MFRFRVCFDLEFQKLQWIKQLNDPLEVVDPEIEDIIELEKARQWKVGSEFISTVFFSLFFGRTKQRITFSFF